MILYALGGQSNMAFLNPKMGLVPTLAAALGTSDVRVAKRAWAGKPISMWGPSEPTGYFQSWLAKIKKTAGDERPELAGICWMQGEADAALGTEKDVYWTKAATLFGALREWFFNELGVDRVPLVIGRISDHAMDDPAWVAIREAQEALADDLSDAAYIDTDDLNRGVHYFTANGYRTLGERFAQAIIALG